jgi:tetratricopeptide (TPR) repeat protein
MIRRHQLVSLSLAVALAAFAAPAFAAPAAIDPFVAGIQAAATGDPRAAAADFERALVVHGWSAGALLDLGNAYANAGERGRAVLAYERAQLLAPRDAAIATSLAQVRQAAGVEAPVPSRVARIVTSLSADEWTWLTFGAAALGCAGLLGLAWSIRRAFARTLVIGGAMLTIVAGAAANYVAPARSAAVIVTTETARIAPFATAEAAFSAPEGETVHIEQHRGDYVYIHDGDRTGWLPRTAVEPVVVGQPAGPRA